MVFPLMIKRWRCNVLYKSWRMLLIRLFFHCFSFVSNRFVLKPQNVAFVHYFWWMWNGVGKIHNVVWLPRRIGESVFFEKETEWLRCTIWKFRVNLNNLSLKKTNLHLYVRVAVDVCVCVYFSLSVNHVERTFGPFIFPFRFTYFWLFVATVLSLVSFAKKNKWNWSVTWSN